MAGIGFDLRRLVEQESGLFSRLRAYAAAGLIAAGPWIVTMASLWLVRAAATWLGREQLEVTLRTAAGDVRQKTLGRRAARGR